LGRDADRLAPTDLRVPLASLRRHAIRLASQAVDIVDGQPIVRRPGSGDLDLDMPAPPARRVTLDDAYLERVAAAYRSAGPGRSPIKAVAVETSGAKLAELYDPNDRRILNARRHVLEARRRGKLPATKPGRKTKAAETDRMKHTT
jgi:hypothetical protein